MSDIRHRLIGGGEAGDAPDAFAVHRREALTWLSAGALASLAACSPPAEKIVASVEGQDVLTPGVQRRYATALPLGGYGRGVEVIAVDGRPIKVEGNPRHPMSLGATDVFAESDILSLYDPSRLRSVIGPTGPSSWQSFRSAIAARMEALKPKGGAGLTLVTGRITSPTNLALIAALQTASPRMKWRRYEPIDDDAATAGARLAFGRPLSVIPKLDAARTIVCLGADPLGPGPMQIAHARAYAKGRKPGSGMSRLYVTEPSASLTGLNADHHLPATPATIDNLALALATAFGAPSPSVTIPTPANRFIQACAADLKARGGMVLVGPGQSPQTHALAHWINGKLSAPRTVVEPLDPNPDPHLVSLTALAGDLKAGRVSDLILIGCNPAFDAPGDLGLAAALHRPAFVAAAGLYETESFEAAAWKLPLSHPLESWGDIRAADGAASVIQPLVKPLHASRTTGELLALLAGQPAMPAHDLVRATWSKLTDDAWADALRSGVIEPASAGGTVPAATLPPSLKSDLSPSGMVLSLSPDPTLYDGGYAENAWLQECPRPATHEVWGATVALAPADAARLGVLAGDTVSLSNGRETVLAPARIDARQAPGVVGGLIGSGRRRAGPIGSCVGVDFAPLRHAASPWTVPIIVARAAAPHRAKPLAPVFSVTHRLQGEARDLSPVLAVGELGDPAKVRRRLKAEPDPPTLPPKAPPADGEPQWAMAIDASACIGCNACVIACQAENNVPVVGPEEVARGRDMHWLRIDAYEVDAALAFQPVPCMQCEHAPCEPVCPVEASVHDHEGLNVQVYNRCIGTRFCESNCPYQVRRFNFFGYAHDQAYENLGSESYKGQKNPEVTVRARGVMEKCTYCVQRIVTVRQRAETEGREIAEGEVATACQSACPTRAISFGDLATSPSIAAARSGPRHYALLAELGTRPRTTYLAAVRNPNPALDVSGGEAG